MINKQNLWFLTLFSLIMVLSIYYLTMSDDTLATLNVSASKDDVTDVVISESDTLVALKVAEEEALVAKIEELQNVLLNESSSLQEKNEAYEKLQDINKNEGSKETIEKLIKDTYSLNSFVSIDGDNIKITIASKTHDAKLANNIIRSVQALYTNSKYITIKFDN
ncbi:MAG: SpoIIIAH-like family protein [Bacilli bacterium]|nr:SpoIIIAH-like family protein [Bacilli bacterium]